MYLGLENNVVEIQAAKCVWECDKGLVPGSTDKTTTKRSFTESAPVSSFMEEPPAKKPKYIEDNSIEKGMAADVDVSRFMKQLKPVLHENETREAEFVPVYVSTVTNLRSLSSLISYLGSKFPLDGLTHFKRIRKVQKADGSSPETEILIGLVSVVDRAPTDHRQALITQHELVLRVHDLPKHEPLMRSQYEAWSEFWPIIFKAHIPSTPPPSDAIDLHDLSLFVSSMRKLIPLAGSTGNACLILDSSGFELAIASHSSSTPLSHCCINVVTDVAEKQMKDTQNIQIDHQKRQNLIAPSASKPAEYLCSSCTAIVVREPCIMCSMALLHSRVARVVYAIPNPTSGGLGSRFSIHCESQLNHHFHVYQGLLADEALSNGCT